VEHKGKTEVSLYGSRIFNFPTMCKQTQLNILLFTNYNRITAAEMKYLRRTAGYTWKD
jgi:hypothetical protein